MATIRQIKEQQDSVKSIHKITSAMQLVATAKSQRAIRELQSYQTYYQKVQHVVGQIVQGSHQPEEFNGTYWIILMSDLGLAGGYNSKIIKTLLTKINKNDKVLVIGNKGSMLQAKISNELEIIPLEVLAGVVGLGDLQIKIQSIYRDDKLKVKVIFTKFISQLEFEPIIRQILPIVVEDIVEEETEKRLATTEFEPSKELLLQEIEEIYIQSVIRGFHREACASEHTSRRTAMENATHNGEDLLRDLNVIYNRTRQSKITQEISEIIGGAEALK